MHVPDLQHEFGISPHILPQVFIRGIHKVTEFAPRNVVGVSQDELRLNAILEKLPSITMVLPLFLSHRPSPCGGIAFQVGLGKLHGGIPSNLGGMYIIVHFRKPSIHNLAVAGTIKVPGFCRLEPFTLGGSCFEGRHQLTKVGPPHLEKYFKLLLGE
jgi:hypothetical protein